MTRLTVDFDADIDGLGVTSDQFNEATGLHPASFLLGKAGVALLQWKRRRDEAAADALFGLAEGKLAHPTLEQLWGSPGTLLAVVHMLEDLPAERQTRWQSLLQRGAEVLLADAHGAALRAARGARLDLDPGPLREQACAAGRGPWLRGVEAGELVWKAGPFSSRRDCATAPTATATPFLSCMP